MACVGVAVKRRIYQRKVNVDMLNAVKSLLAVTFRALALRQSKEWIMSCPALCDKETQKCVILLNFAVSLLASRSFPIGKVNHLPDSQRSTR